MRRQRRRHRRPSRRRHRRRRRLRGLPSSRGDGPRWRDVIPRPRDVTAASDGAAGGGGDGG